MRTRSRFPPISFSSCAPGHAPGHSCEVRRNLHHEHGIRLLHALLVRSVVRCCDRDVDAAAIGIRHERRGAGVLPAGRVASHAAVTVLVDEQPNSAGMPLPNGDTTSAVRAHPEIMARFACEPMPPFPRVSMLFETWSMVTTEAPPATSRESSTCANRVASVVEFESSPRRAIAAFT